MASFMEPVRPIEAVPWGWNPGQTFVTAFNESRLTKAKADQLQMEAELEQLLFPVAQKKAALELDKMQFEVERQSLMLDMARDAQRQAHRAQMSGLKGSSGSGSTVPGSGNTVQTPGIIDTSNVNFRSNTPPSPNNDTVDFDW